MRIFPTRILVATDGSEEAARRRTVFQPLGGSFANEKPPPLYSPECVEEKICELRPNGVLRSWLRTSNYQATTNISQSGDVAVVTRMLRCPRRGERSTRGAGSQWCHRLPHTSKEVTHRETLGGDDHGGYGDGCAARCGSRFRPG
jgi:hypothetical protein